MKSYNLNLIIILLCTTACNSVFPGTQVGTEEQLTCTQISSETLSNLDEIPDGFALSPREVIDGLGGSYTGLQMDENEAPTSETVSLLVSDPSSIVTVQYYSGGEDDIEYYEDPCPPRYLFELDFTLDADGFPLFNGTVEVNYTANADGDSHSGYTIDESLLNATLPTPVSFNPNDWEVVEPLFWMSSCDSCGWYVALTWEAYNASEVVEGEDYYVENELLFHASLTPEPPTTNEQE